MQTKRLRCDYASGAGSSEEAQKACVVRGPHVTMTPLITRGTDAEHGQGAKRVEDGLPVMQSGAVKTSEKCGNQTV